MPHKKIFIPTIPGISVNRLTGCNKILILSFIFLISFLSKPLAQVDLKRGLMGYWPLNGSAFDVSGNSRNGISIGNVKAASDRFGKANSAIELDGNDSYIVVPDKDGTLITGNFSITAWFHTTNSNVQTIIGKVLFGQVPINEQLQLYINWPVTPGIGSVIIPEGAPCALGHLFAESRLATGEDLCRERWYFMAVTLDGSMHRLYLDGKLMASRNTGFSKVTSCTGNLQFGAWWNNDPQFFKGFMDEVRVYNRAINPDEVAALYGENRGVDTYDFSFLQEICNPLKVNFFYNGAGNQITWEFEPGKTGVGRRPQHTFSAIGEYPVKMIVAYNNCRKNDTLVKNVQLKFTDAPLIFNKDTIVCPGNPLTLRSAVSDNFCWFPTDGMTHANSPNPVVTPQKATTYFLTHKKEGPNLVVNGDFSNGNSGFTTTYLYRLNNTTEGEYFVSPFPRNWNIALDACNQPNGTSGNMLLVNGVPEPNKLVWSQQINVQPGKTYDFGLFITALYPVNPALLQFSINNTIVGDSIQANDQPCNWKQFTTTWNAGGNTKAVISIVNRNTEVQGNDFALDNITFREINFEIDSIRISMGTASIKVTKDTAACRGSSVQLKAEGAATYSWFPSTGLNNPSIANPTATVQNNTTYYVKGIASNGCEANDSVTISAIPLPLGKVVPSASLVCGIDTLQLEAQGGTRYEWSPSMLISDVNIANPTVIIKEAITYRVKIFNASGCSALDSVVFSWKEKPLFGLQSDNPSICAGASVKLSALGGNRYRWSPAGLVGNADAAETVSSPNATTTFTVKIWDDNCRDSAELATVVRLLPGPVANAVSSNDITCTVTSTQLQASGGVAYLWSPANGLSAVNIANPVARPAGTTTYYVRVTDENNCVSKDSVTVHFTASGDVRGYQMPTAFTPNGDGLNDCFGVGKWGNVVNIDQFDIFNRWGQIVFKGGNANNCWDGSVNGKPQPSGSYVYKIIVTTSCGVFSQQGTVILIQ